MRQCTYVLEKIIKALKKKAELHYAQYGEHVRLTQRKLITGYEI
jgi:hypothetical protein